MTTRPAITGLSCEQLASLFGFQRDVPFVPKQRRLNKVSPALPLRVNDSDLLRCTRSDVSPSLEVDPG